MGATGQNLPGAQSVPHAHNAIWRVDIDLNGPIDNAAHATHSENPANPAGTASDATVALPTAQGFTWSPRTHDAVVITSPTLKNAHGNATEYHFVPLPTGGGLTTHFEKFTQNDFWVTPYNPSQFAAKNLPSYIAGSPSIANRDLVVWYKGSLHHHPRDEDGVFNGSGVWIGTADVMWTGLMLVPHNLFDCSPFFRPSCP